MKSKIISHTGGPRRFVLVFETGDEVIDLLTRFAAEHEFMASHFTAIGAFSSAVLAYFDWQSRQYQDIPVQQQVEVLSFMGDIAKSDGKPVVHAHAVLGRCDGSVMGGHLMEAHVRPTLELILTQSPDELHRKMDPVSGLPLISI